MGLLQSLIELDTELLFFLNSFHNGFWDNFFWMFTSKEVWLPLYLTLAYVIFKNHGLKGLVTILSIGLLIVLCDQISTNVFKQGFERLRPSRDEDLQFLVHLINGKRGGMYGFVSSHSTNSFGLAIFTSLLFRNRTYSIFIFSWAAINAYSRVYMGVHYPGDIIGGMLLGLILGRIVYGIYLRVLPRFVVISHHNKRLLKSGISDSFGNDSRLVFFSIILMTGTLLMAAKVMLKITG
ncbi:phosphatase PAP2 family protein [Carboxylicivirga marina]|uniref:Phosphatase PAP2 family protein n=1 Tax=Carboxylicivirga marina TaxID=2800988 RepID=A0ABS1HPV6_9BACT|nr:phosphatase PAP2 family protein [Carboxylicivirga marina]MBK3519707.1 phosphatase PAP2 family protein [Carboxylicivirga marina]